MTIRADVRRRLFGFSAKSTSSSKADGAAIAAAGAGKDGETI
jgi:hypothetical protein